MFYLRQFMENGYLTVTHCRQKVFCRTAAMFEPALRKYSLSLLVSSEGKDAFRSTLVKDFYIRRLKVTPSDSKLHERLQVFVLLMSALF